MQDRDDYVGHVCEERVLSGLVFAMGRVGAGANFISETRPSGAVPNGAPISNTYIAEADLLVRAVLRHLLEIWQISRTALVEPPVDRLHLAQQESAYRTQSHRARH